MVLALFVDLLLFLGLSFLWFGAVIFALWIAYNSDDDSGW